MAFRRRGWFPRADYVRAAQRRQAAAREAAKLARTGRSLAPVRIEGRQIATTFWGKSWCQNLERYSDFANRLPRGRSYVRSGAVIDLSIKPGEAEALVSGTDLYRVVIRVGPVPRPQWKQITRDLSGAIDSVVELLQGKLSTAVMTRLCAPGTGLFPQPQEIQFSCSCPDAASMCKHVAAVLYGIGGRLDIEPSLLFALRRVSEADLVVRTGTIATLIKGTDKSSALRKTIDEAALAEVFGIDLAPIRPRRTRRSRRK